MAYDFLLIRSYDRTNALARVQSDPLLIGLNALGCSVHKHSITEKTELDNIKCKNIIVHYDDTASLIYAHKLKLNLGGSCKILCLTSDIYNLERYLNIDEFVDLFIAPTLSHKEVLESAVNNSVITVPESIDPIAYRTNDVNVLEVVEDKNNFCWFGYQESYDKSMRYIVKKIKSENISLNKFGIITNPNVILDMSATHYPFSEVDFYKFTENYGYCLLSHFSYDCHLNTIIKSPNKLITSIVRGMIPIASDTRNYREILEYLDLTELLNKKPIDFVNRLQKLDYERDYRRFNLETKSAILEIKFSPVNNAQILLNRI